MVTTRCRKEDDFITPLIKNRSDDSDIWQVTAPGEYVPL